MRQSGIFKRELGRSRKSSWLGSVVCPVQTFKSLHALTAFESAIQILFAKNANQSEKKFISSNSFENLKHQHAAGISKHTNINNSYPCKHHSCVGETTSGLHWLIPPNRSFSSTSSLYSKGALNASGASIVLPASLNSKITPSAEIPSWNHPAHAFSVEGRQFCSSSSPFQPPHSQVGRYVAYGFLLAGSGLATYYFYPNPNKTKQQLPQEEHTVTNWSGTHEAKTKNYLQPESLKELEAIVKDANKKKQKIRPVGSGLSPNGIGLSDDGMINLALMDKIVDIDKEENRVTVQAGARVGQVVEELKPHGLTLQNFASIKEQQIGGFIQVSAHGTGAVIPPVDEQVISLKLVTPALGTLELSPQSNADLFYLARCGLGALGVVAEATLQCVPRHRLLEYTFATNVKEIRKKHKKWLQENRHLRYMWIPYTDTVVVVQSNPLPEGREPPNYRNRYEPEERLKHVRALYKRLSAEYRPSGGTIEERQGYPGKTSDEKAGLWSGTGAGSQEPLGILTDDELSTLSFTELRDKLLALDPLSKELVIQINKAEAEYWKRSEGYRVGWSDEILSFDCGGQQWVSEVCFPSGTPTNPNLKDIAYVDEILKIITKEGFPAPAPIEQRWTASSRSSMSLASSSSAHDLFSWVGIIMYLPTANEEQREAITKKFFQYRHATQKQLWDPYRAFEHWAKLELPADAESLAWIQNRLRSRFPVESFNKARMDLDPHNILSNEVIDKMFPQIEK
ncbi:hypothetical protein O6H91_16G033700 [Diphasiastrum complanatum]|uniref:Uncharacterized protein n=3 Tax=Diphasiastrum complanatum TaxID=34168 RepID=A0ACC2BC92_DIPCM|nr:hypothetical protein O6H91_16G033700 [Diphasiastrum complanatum]KAJ7527042.1 hypothetical protein O6H91_16G033700 [Diphasiastrum complanatum]KAJ7527043.1 hypothetical protein O6H91_16G033700 [Diphasiastrum complanatum]